MQFNACMTTAYLRSMQHLPSLQATVLSLSANILVSGALGRLLFREPLALTWLLGAGCIICGVALITQAAAVPPKVAAEPDQSPKKLD